MVHYLAKIDGVWYSVPVDDDGNAIPLGSIEVKDSPAAGGNSRSVFY